MCIPQVFVANGCARTSATGPSKDSASSVITRVCFKREFVGALQGRRKVFCLGGTNEIKLARAKKMGVRARSIRV